MQINVAGKLWMAFFVTICLCVLSLYLLLHSSLKRGFLDYTSQQAAQRLTILSSSLNNIYAESGSFAPLQADPDRWLTLKNIIFAENDTLFTADPNGPPLARHDEAMPASGTQLQQSQQHYREFVSSITLHDVDKTLLIGFLKPNQILSWVPIMRTGEAIGYIGFVKPTVVTRQADKRFMQQQFKVFGIVSFLVVLISTVVAMVFARRISRPLKNLAEGAQALAAGDYSRTLPIQSRDEVGQLCQSFNQLAQALAANEKLRALWIADVSHEMRTPLSVIKVQIEAMQDGIRPTNQDNLGLLYNKVVDLNTLIDDLFELSLSDIGALTYNKKKIVVNTLLQQCIEVFQIKAQNAQLTLADSSRCDEDLILSADPKRLQQLFYNLFENATRYTHPGGRIEVNLSHQPGAVTITLDDSEPGVPAAQTQQIFERLYRVEHSRSRATGGAGLGLAICKNIVEAHQGTISAQQSPLGGLRICVTLPC